MSKIMMMRENEKSMRTLAMLRYQADRYQSVGNGSMCQRVNAEIRRLVSQMSESSKIEYKQVNNLLDVVSSP